MDKIFWYTTVAGIINSLIQIGNAVITKKFELYILIASIVFNLFTLIWGIMRHRAKWAPRLIMPAFFFVYASLGLLTCFSEPESVLRKDVDLYSINVQMITLFAVMVVLLSHTEFYVILFFYSPIYIVFQSIVIAQRIAFDNV